MEFLNMSFMIYIYQKKGDADVVSAFHYTCPPYYTFAFTTLLRVRSRTRKGVSVGALDVFRFVLAKCVPISTPL